MLNLRDASDTPERVVVINVGVVGLVVAFEVVGIVSCFSAIADEIMVAPDKFGVCVAGLSAKSAPTILVSVAFVSSATAFSPHQSIVVVVRFGSVVTIYIP